MSIERLLRLVRLFDARPAAYVVVALAVSGLLWALVFWYPMSDDIRELTQDIARLDHTIQTQHLSDVSSAAANISSDGSLPSEVAGSLAGPTIRPEELQRRLLTAIEAHAGTLALWERYEERQPDEQQRDPSTWSVHIRIQGGFNSVVAMLSDLLNIPGVRRIGDLQMSAGPMSHLAEGDPPVDIVADFFVVSNAEAKDPQAVARRT